MFFSMETELKETEKKKQEIERLEALLTEVKKCHTTREKIACLDEIEEVKEAFSSSALLTSFISGLSDFCEYVIKATFAIKQGKHLFTLHTDSKNPILRLRALLEDLLAIEDFYASIGGIIGYQRLVLELLERKEKEDTPTLSSLHPPHGIDLSKDSLEVRQAVIEGVRAQEYMAELYPVGGAADRLELKDEQTQEGLPAARLVFLGKHLLEGVIHDLQAREYLHFKLFAKQVVTPIAMMTSKVHRNHDHILEICKQNNWFGRPEESFLFFTQPSVPVFTEDGKWCLQKAMKLLLKPGGHGVIWKLADQAGVFEKLKAQGKTKALIRQINNPMAGTDQGLLAFLGTGHQKNKSFGFASCPRLVNAQEGMNVLKTVPHDQGLRLSMTNVEYCDFEKFGIEDKPQDPQGKYSHFPSNTNILFADLNAAAKVVQTLPFPGLLVNFRKGNHFVNGEMQKTSIARLESTMQNLADGFEVEAKSPLSDATVEALPTYLTFNERRKTISTTKRKSAAKGSMLETPEGCYYDFMQNAKELLENYCGMQLPPILSEHEFVTKGPSFLFSYHPALGPLYSLIGQKIRGGKLEEGSELQLEIADVELSGLELSGSLIIEADQVMGHSSDQGTSVYSSHTGQCSLRNVRVENAGVDWEEDHLFWKHEIKRKGCLKIHLKGHSRFIAENVTLSGNKVIEVPDGVCLRAYEKEGEVVFEERPLEDFTPFWHYHVDADSRIQISRA